MIQIYNSKNLHLCETIQDYHLLKDKLTMESYSREKLEQLLLQTKLSFFTQEDVLSHDRFKKLADFIAWTIYHEKDPNNFLCDLGATLDIQGVPIEIEQLPSAQIYPYHVEGTTLNQAIFVTENKILMQKNEESNSSLFYLSPLQDGNEIQKIMEYKNSLK